MKYDFLYPYHFDSNINESIKRIRASIGSIIHQDVNVCVSNTSNHCIYKYIKDFGKINYLHTPSNTRFNKPKTINYGVINLIESEYFFLSDIDLVYQENHVNNITEILNEYNEPVRIVHKNYNISYPSYSPKFTDHMKRKKIDDPSGRPWEGYAHGNGLIHRPSFYKVCGYDEFFIGYAPEDDEFNQRIKHVSKLIYSDREDVITAHIFHPRAAVDNTNYELNMYYYWDVLRELRKKENSDTLTYHDIWTNKGKQWGIL